MQSFLLKAKVKGIMISGFMIAKNLLKQGYPFVEAVASALPVCDEFLISDGIRKSRFLDIIGLKLKV